jgi:ribosome-associated translation inhibitor RaiA
MARDAQEMSVVIHFRDVATDEEVRDHLEQRCQSLADEFPETLRYEITLQDNNGPFSAHARATGRKTNAAAHIDDGLNLRHAGDQVLDKLERELRREHDKRIFSPRRKAQKSPSKRTG